MAGKPESQGEQPPVVSRDGGGMSSTYANAVDVSAGREEINVLFGVERVGEAGQDEVRVLLSRRFAMSPLAAKRFAIDLRKVLEDRDAGWGADPTGSAVASEGTDVRPDNGSDATGAEAGLEKILKLFRLIGGLNTRIDLEPSFKATHGRLLENRFLLGVDRRELNAGADEQIVSICERIGMPVGMLAAFSRSLPDANHVYFGVEKDEKTLMFKTYLECRDKIEKELGAAAAAGLSFPLFTGYKWDTGSPGRQAVTRYDWYPSLPGPDMLERLCASVGLDRHGALFEIARGIVERASGKIDYGDIQYLEVSEERNPRRSFDLNIYKSGLRIVDLFPQLLAILQHFAIPSGRFESLYQRIKAERFGHLAGGIDRSGKEFVTVYYGVNQVHSSQFGTATIGTPDRPQGAG